MGGPNTTDPLARQKMSRQNFTCSAQDQGYTADQIRAAAGGDEFDTKLSQAEYQQLQQQRPLGPSGYTETDTYWKAHVAPQDVPQDEQQAEAPTADADAEQIARRGNQAEDQELLQLIQAFMRMTGNNFSEVSEMLGINKKTARMLYSQTQNPPGADHIGMNNFISKMNKMNSFS